MKKAQSFAILSLLFLASCLHVAPKTTPTAPVTEQQIAEFTATCTAIWREELDRAIEAEGLAGCIEQAKAGGTAETIREHVRTSEEYKLRLERIERERKEAEERERLRGKLRGRLRPNGQKFVDASGKDFVPVFASTLAALTRDDRALLFDQLKDLGFNGIRIFAGRLTWGPQDAALVKQRLPIALKEAAERGFYVQVSALTDTRGWEQDEESWLRTIADLTRDAENVLLEVANEPYHGTQSELVNNFTALCAMASRVLADYPNPWALGAASEDEPVNGRYGTQCGTFNTVHVRRGNVQDMIDALFGVREIARVTDKPVLNSEPIGAAEATIPGRRLADVEFFGRMSRRGKSLGFGAVFHSEDGLFGRTLGPVQLAAAKAFVAGFSAPDEDVPAPVIRDACEASDIDTPLEILQCYRDRYQGKMTDEQKIDFMRASAKRMNARGLSGGPFGLLLKPGGNNCSSNGVAYSCDIICSGQGAQQRQWDVLVAQETEQRPEWSEVMRPGLAERVCEIVR